MAEKENSLKPGHLIEKSKKLVWAKFKDWNANDLRLLEVYLSKIDARDPDSSNVRFTLREYADLIGCPNLRKEQVQACTDKFMGNVVTIQTNEDDENEWSMYTLFPEAHCFKDKELKQYVVEIDCNSKIKDIFFNLAQDGYIQYRLRNTVKMEGRYSVQLYGLMLDMMHIKGGWQMNMPKLREQLGATSRSYKSFRDFRRVVLDPAIKEINEKSDIDASYDCVKTGRKVTAVHFVANRKPSESKASPKVDNKPNPYAECLSDLEPSQAKRIGDMVKRKIKALYPDLDAEKVDAATLAALKNAHKKLLDERNDYPKNPAGYVWSVLSKDTAIDEFVPGDILF